MAVMSGVGSEASRKRRRAAPANAASTQAASVEEHLAALRSRWQVCVAEISSAGAAGTIARAAGVFVHSRSANVYSAGAVLR